MVGGRLVLYLLRGSQLAQSTILDHPKTVSERQCFGSIMGHDDGGRPEPRDQGTELAHQLIAKHTIERTERFIEQEQTGRGCECSGQCNSLLLTAGE